MITDCGAANLLAAIFREDPNSIKKRLGIPLPNQHACPNCGKLISKVGKGRFCNKKCWHDFTHITLVCDCSCGNVFTRPQSHVIYHINHPHPVTGKSQERIFYSRKCLHKWLRENGAYGPRRKWDWDLVWQKHLEKGYGALRLGRLLHMPTATVDKILHRKKLELLSH